ncbi:enoyl-CoA hydratase/isomerase family protein [Rhizorhapis suberifaciens]|uniref:2-(1,2-epoxy-1,2-dihydrophenyl)acetyl-CoA isomerase n=1 Tax=Rhizorhapis suberifaciens TaxID=13656 RepID=A0A840HX92_9SPHN|nr:enoyl-CoA hydratase-related protein [Rhizorhapis suberifaciens]MBB4642982.1 2-(1,2-epoxy-1,2-dihydrophenyl)acetyl-CoA isomerase [Rhizorhapis suberifaciens]
MSENPPFLVDRADGVLTLSFNRPEQGNAITQEAVPGLTELFVSIATDPSVRVVLVRGEGPNFTAGGDVRGFLRAIEQPVAARRADFAARLNAVQAMVEAYLAIPVPIIAACQGAVAGAGLMFALGADYVIGDETVNFLFSHQKVGLPPDGGVSLLLPRVVGQRRAAELILTAARIGADEAFRLGLATRIVASAELAKEGNAQAKRFARAPVGAVRQAKQLLASSGAQSAAAQLKAERDAIVEAVGQPDFEEGVRAFLEKRQPAFPSTLLDP